MSKNDKLKQTKIATRQLEQDGFPSARTRETNDTAPERAIALKAMFRDHRDLEDPFAEIRELCATAGAEVVDAVAQNVHRINAATYLGKGKIKEVAERAKELDVDLIVTDNDLSPAQERNIEKMVECTVIDRSQLIMDIFSRRASTLQAKLQVELAQLRYTFPRLKRMWTHLSRYEGGIGMRGPGETQLESDKRLIQRRILKLQSRLKEIEQRKDVSLRQRRDDLVIALVGYTNVGKSTLLNRLTGSAELVEDKLFATLDTRTRKWHIDNNRHVLLNDTVGFIRELPHHLVASFHATLAETRQANILFHVVDASSSEAEMQIRAVEGVLHDIKCEQDSWLILNKWDQVPDDRALEAGRMASRANPNAPTYRVSAVTGIGLEELQGAILEHLDRHNRVWNIVLPPARGDLLAYVQRNGHVVRQEFNGQSIHLEVEMSIPRVNKLRSMYPEGIVEE
jgi:GTP-binding protein HflX